MMHARDRAAEPERGRVDGAEESHRQPRIQGKDIGQRRGGGGAITDLLERLQVDGRKRREGIPFEDLLELGLGVGVLAGEKFQHPNPYSARLAILLAKIPSRPPSIMYPIITSISATRRAVTDVGTMSPYPRVVSVTKLK